MEKGNNFIKSFINKLKKHQSKKDSAFYILQYILFKRKYNNYTFYVNLSDIKNIILEYYWFTSIIYLVIPAKLKKKVNF